MPFIPYNVDDDPVIDALQAEGASDPDVIGILLTGSRAVGAVTAESDYDVIFIVSDETKERYERENREPPRGHTLDPEINTEDIQWHECPRTLREYNTFGVDVCRVVYDRTGELTALAEELGRMPEEDAHATATRAYDDYMNGIFRTLKCRHRGNELGARLEAAQTVDVLLRMLFALERQWPPFGSRVHLHLDILAGQGWQPGELHASLHDMLTTADARRHETTMRRVVALMAERGYGHVYDGWKEQIDRMLARSF
jgi:hypothetical protein